MVKKETPVHCEEGQSHCIFPGKGNNIALGGRRSKRPPSREGRGRTHGVSRETRHCFYLEREKRMSNHLPDSQRACSACPRRKGGGRGGESRYEEKNNWIKVKNRKKKKRRATRRGHEEHKGGRGELLDKWKKTSPRTHSSRPRKMKKPPTQN